MECQQLKVLAACLWIHFKQNLESLAKLFRLGPPSYPTIYLFVFSIIKINIFIHSLTAIFRMPHVILLQLTFFFCFCDISRQTVILISNGFSSFTAWLVYVK